MLYNPVVFNKFISLGVRFAQIGWYLRIQIQQHMCDFRSKMRLLQDLQELQRRDVLYSIIGCVYYWNVNKVKSSIQIIIIFIKQL